MNKVKINDVEYEISPLKMKHLRRISEMVSEGKDMRNATFTDLDRWVTFMADSIKEKNPSFTEDMLGDLTMTGFAELWKSIIEISGIRFVPKGEANPTETSTMEPSTAASPSQSVGHIQ